MTERYIPFGEIETRADDKGPLVIEGYFARFDDVYKIFDGATESIARGAFTESMNGDVRALYNHNADIVLGRTSAGTMTLRQDDVGLWGRIELDPGDTDAVNAYRRIQRKSITGCSFGFDIEKEERTVNPDGTVHWTIQKVNPLYEVSPCAFPAYEGTSITARKKEFEDVTNEMRQRKLDAWKETQKRRLTHGNESPDAPQED